MPTQTLASGNPALADRYGNFGVSGFEEVTDPAFIFGAIVGEGGAGKTSLFREHEGALIINADMHSVPRPSSDCPPSLAQFWPVQDAKGRILGTDGTPIRLCGTNIFRMRDDLLQAAEKDQPRPQTIVIDTLAPTVPLFREAYAHEKGFTEWDAMPDGNPRRKAYGAVYDSYLEFICSLRYAGYGVYIVAHLMTQYYEKENGTTVVKVSHNIPDKIFMRLFPLLEFLGAVEITWEDKYELDQQGKPIYEKVTRIPKRQLVNLSEKLSKEMNRARVALPERITLPPIGGWQAFRSAYLAAAGAPTSTETSSS